MKDLYSVMRLLHSSVGQQVEEKTLWTKDQTLAGLAIPGLTFVDSALTTDQKAFVLAFLYMSSVRSPLEEVFLCTAEEASMGRLTQSRLRREA